MNVRTLCLAILSYGDATGYEIRKQSIEGRFSHFVDASFGAIYPALGRLTEAGLVTVRDEVQTGKPGRRVYSITPAGRAALHEALCEMPNDDVFKSPFLLVAMFSETLPRGHVQRAVDIRISDLEEKLQGMRHCLAEMEARGAAGSVWILRYGIAVHEASLDHLKSARSGLLDIAGTALDVPDAAE